MRKAIVFAILVAPAIGDDAQTAFDALKKEWEAACAEFLRPAREAEAKGEKFQPDWTRSPNVVFAPRFAAFAKEHPKTEAAAQALMMALQIGEDEAARKEAVQALLRDHLASRALKEVIYDLDEDALKRIAEKSPHADMRGCALLRLAELRMETGDGNSALQLAREVRAQYADLDGWRGKLGHMADGDIFEIENLGIGKVAPEIEGVDLDGKPMKLGDFRGKVVVLDFWGDW